MAPILGYTDRPYRRLWRRCFEPALSKPLRFVTPFVSVTAGLKVSRLLRDDQSPWGWDEGEIPQLLGNQASALAAVSKEFSAAGFTEVNWNIGCPVRDVARKQRGSGLLPFAQTIRQILEEWLTCWPGQLSVKLRLGRWQLEEFPAVVQVLNDFPLKEVILHPRLGCQMYDGVPHRPAAAVFLEQSKHPVIWSGDIFTPADGVAVIKDFPTLKGVMLGRGLLADPFLALALDQPDRLPSARDQQQIRLEFFQLVYEDLAHRYPSPRALLGRLKGFLEYPLRYGPFAQAFPEGCTLVQQALSFDQLQPFLKPASVW